MLLFFSDLWVAAECTPNPRSVTLVLVTSVSKCHFTRHSHRFKSMVTAIRTAEPRKRFFSQMSQENLVSRFIGATCTAQKCVLVAESDPVS